MRTSANGRGRALGAAALLLGTWTAVATGAQAPDRCAGEPAPPVEARVRVVERTDGAGAVRLRIELSLVSHLATTSVRVRLDRDGTAAARGALPPDERHVTLPRGVWRRLPYVVDLERGRRHDLRFVVVRDDAGGEIESARAWLRLDLEPSRAPRDLGDVLEYRATAPEEAGP